MQSNRSVQSVRQAPYTATPAVVHPTQSVLLPFGYTGTLAAGVSGNIFAFQPTHITEILLSAKSIGTTGSSTILLFKNDTALLHTFVLPAASKVQLLEISIPLVRLEWLSVQSTTTAGHTNIVMQFNGYFG